MDNRIILKGIQNSVTSFLLFSSFQGKMKGEVHRSAHGIYYVTIFYNPRH